MYLLYLSIKFGAGVGIVDDEALMDKTLELNPAKIYLFKDSNRNTRKRCEICSKLTVKTPEWRQWRRSGVFIVNFKHVVDLFLVFPLLTLNK